MGIFRLYANLGIGNDADIDIKSLPEATDVAFLNLSV